MAGGGHIPNCCPSSCQHPSPTTSVYGNLDSKNRYVGGAPFTMDEAAVDPELGKWRHGMPMGSQGFSHYSYPPLCEWPPNEDGVPTRPTDRSIHMIRVAACGAEFEPFCALIKVTKNATDVIGFGTSQPTDRR